MHFLLKRYNFLVVLLLVLFSMFTALPAKAETSVSFADKICLDDVPIFFAHPPQIENGRIMVDGERIASALQMDMKMLDNGQTLLFTRGNATAQFTAGSNQASLNGVSLQLEVTPFKVYDTSYVPLRELAEVCGAYIKWDENVKTVNIVSNESFVFLQGVPAQVVGKVSAEQVNRWWREEKSYELPPYKPGTWVTELVLTEDTKFSRVFDGRVSGKYGGWLMKCNDIEGLTPEQIRDLFALPALPAYQVDVIVKAGTHLHSGLTNQNKGWGNGGGIQFDLMGQRTGEFLQERPLPGAVIK